MSSVAPSYIFPRGRHGRSELPHMMKFEIFRSKTSSDTLINTASVTTAINNIGEGAKNALGVAGVAIEGAASLASAAVSSASDNNILNGVAKGSVGALADIGDAMYEAGKKKKESVANIYLPIPSNLQDNNQADWGMANENPLGVLIAGMATGDNNALIDASKRFVTENILQGGAIPTRNIIGSTFNVAATAVRGNSSPAGRQLGFTYAPYRTLLYNAPKFKSFHFSWILAPSNADEASELDGIVYMFKKYMSPSTSKTSSENFLLYPEQCSITFLSENKNNTFLPIILECVISSVTVSYDNKFHSDGSPSRIMLSVGVTEASIWTQEVYQEKYSEQENRANKRQAETDKKETATSNTKT